ncbi:caspase family protein [Streptomyces sp. NPDC056660]|uniref:caspase family protein n=1 Tax=Streptomyces sp. NPDC056660 TaxID=3345897 RepID=UPI00369FC4C8
MKPPEPTADCHLSDSEPPLAARHVFAVGAADYRDPSWDPLPQVRLDVATIIKALNPFGYRPASAWPAGLINPGEARDIEMPLLRWLRSVFSFDDDTLIIYHAGHGTEEHDHYLICSETDYDAAALKVTALPTARLVELAGDAGVQRLLVIIDACYAGDGAADVLAQTAKIHLVSAGTRANQRRHWKSLAVLSAARPGEIADDGAFAEAMSTVLRTTVEEDRILAGERPAYVHLSDVVREINREFARRAIPQRADLAVIHDDGRGFLSNPRHVAGLSIDLDLAEQRVASEQVKLREKELIEHFGPRGAGTHGPGETGHYFTGRTMVLSRLARWLRGESEQNIRLYQVTGGPGTGKSSVLGRLVTRSDPVRRHTIPDDTVIVSTDIPTNSIDLAIHAAGKRLPDVLAALSDALDTPTSSRSDVMTAIKNLRSPFTFVVDAIDEASMVESSYEAENIVTLLQRATALTPYFRVLLGARPEVLNTGTSTDDRTARIDLDDPQWIARRDITDYAAQLLSAPHGQGSSSELPDRLVEWAAPEIGRVTYPNYLVTRIVARTLANPNLAFWNADPAEWASLLPDPLEEQINNRRRHTGSYPGIGPAFLWARNLQLDPQKIELYRAVLLPLAYREGEGLPLAGVWTCLASAMYGKSVSEKQITEILATDAAAAYVTEAIDAHGRSVYRLYHQALVDNLRSGHQNGVSDYLLSLPESLGMVHSKQVRRVIAREIYRALVDSVFTTSNGLRDWQNADPYLLDHLAAHAAAASTGDELLADTEFLVYAKADSVAALLRQAGSEEAVRGARVYRASLGWHRNVDPDTRRWVLVLDAARLEDHELADRLKRGRISILPWPQWNTASPRPGLLRTIDADASVLTATPEYPLAITAGTEGTVRFWDLIDGQPFLDLEPVESGAVTSLTSTVIEDRIIVITGHINGDVRVWDANDEPVQNRLAASTSTSATIPVISLRCILAEEHLIAIATSADGSTTIWDTETGNQVSSLPSEAYSGSHPITGNLYGSPNVVTARPGGGFSLWYLPSGESVALDDDISASGGEVTALAAATIDNKVAILTGNSDGELHRWFVSSSRIVSEGLPESATRGAVRGDRVRTVAASRLEETVVAVTGHESGHVQLWDLEGASATSLLGHKASVHSASFVELDTGLAAVTADDAGILSIWDLQHAATSMHKGLGVSAMACTSLDDRTAVVTGHIDGSIGLWDACAGYSISRHAEPTPQSGSVVSIGCTHAQSRILTAASYSENFLRLWEIGTPDDAGRLLSLDCRVNSLTCTNIEDLGVAVTGHDDGSIGLWDLVRQERLTNLLPPGGPPVVSVACNSDLRSAMAITAHDDGSCRIWDLERRLQLNEFRAVEQSDIATVALSSSENGTFAVVGHRNGGVLVRDIAAFGSHGMTMRGKGTELVSLTCIARGSQRLVLCGHSDGTLDLFNLATQTHVQSVPVSVNVSALAWSPLNSLLTMVAGSDLYVMSDDL